LTRHSDDGIEEVKIHADGTVIRDAGLHAAGYRHRRRNLNRRNPVSPNGEHRRILPGVAEYAPLLVNLGHRL